MTIKYSDMKKYYQCIQNNANYFARGDLTEMMTGEICLNYCQKIARHGRKENLGERGKN